MKKIFISLILAFTIGFSATAIYTECKAEKTLKLPIVMYHQLSTDYSKCGDYVLELEQFEKDIIYLKEHGYRSITLKQLEDWCNFQTPLPEKPVMITFDDGYETTSVWAAEILKEHNMTAVVSIIGSVTQQYTDNEDHTLRYSHMNWNEINKAIASGVLEVQCHTYDMHRLSPRRGCGQKKGESDEEYKTALYYDLVKFKEEFQKNTGTACSAIALPYGFYNRLTLETANEAGFGVIFTCNEKINNLSGDYEELSQLCRYNRPTGKSSADFFAVWEKNY